MKYVGRVCICHPPCAGARTPEDKDEGKRSFPLWSGPTTFLIMIAEVLPSLPVVFLDRLSVSRHDQLWLALVSPALSFRRGNEGNLPERNGAQRFRALAPWVSLMTLSITHACTKENRFYQVT